jgi:hypothetical protein
MSQTCVSNGIGYVSEQLISNRAFEGRKLIPVSHIAHVVVETVSHKEAVETFIGVVTHIEQNSALYEVRAAESDEVNDVLI